MTIALFAIIGAKIEAGFWYWLVFAAYCVWSVFKFTYDFGGFDKNEGNDTNKAQ